MSFNWTKGLLPFVIGLMPAVCFFGCGSGNTATPPANSSPPTNQEARKSSNTNGLPAQLTAVSPQPNQGIGEGNPALIDAADVGDLLKANSENPLIGSWLGAATLDSGLLTQKLQRVDDEERARLQKVAQIFLSYQVAMDFYSDGRLGMVVQFTLDGQEQLVSATGTWKIVQRDEDSVIVELVEQIEDKTPNTSQVRIMVHPDGHQIARPAELDSQLAVCEPMFVFNRIPEDFLHQVEVANRTELQKLK